MILDINMDSDIKNWLAEDIPTWDISSLNMKANSKARIVAKDSGILCGTDVLIRIFKLLGIHLILNFEEGSPIKPKDVIAEIEGKSHKILQGERVALNILGHMSGISTFTNNILDNVKKINPNIKISATRKTLPGLRKYQKWAVYTGGGDTHRLSLSSMVMLKENHLSTFNSLTEAITKTKKNLSFSHKIEVETTNEIQAIEALEAGADIIMLDNFSPKDALSTARLLKGVSSTILIEISGNIDENNISSYVSIDVDIISLGKLTHSVKTFDFSMIFDT